MMAIIIHPGSIVLTSRVDGKLDIIKYFKEIKYVEIYPFLPFGGNYSIATICCNSMVVGELSKTK
jgi:hypothetical protein